MSDKTEYLMLFRGIDWHRGLSPQEIQEVMVRIKAWFDSLVGSGKVKGGQPLVNEGRVISGKGGRVVADGPFAEAKEAVGGYFLVECASLDEAVKMAQGCPSLEYGALVEVRQIAADCPMLKEMKKSLGQEQLAPAA